MVEERIIKFYGANISVFSDGSVWIHRGSKNKRRFGNTTYKGYKATIIRDNGKPRTVFVHRLVALAFVPNPDNLPQVNHINGIKTDNRPENLEWCTNKDNAHHRACVLKSFSFMTPVICVETGTKYNTVSEASRKTGINRSNIQRCLKDGRRGISKNRYKQEQYSTMLKRWSESRWISLAESGGDISVACW